jgi:AAA-like domain/CHAT domain
LFVSEVPVRKILVLTANPKNSDRLRLDKEVQELEEGLERARRWDEFEIITKWAVRTKDLQYYLLHLEPQIVHFSGHGAGSDGLALEDNGDEGQVQLVSSAALAQLFGLFKDKLECVLLNACYSEVQAEAIYEHIDCVIGMNQAIGDRAAIKFTEGFYGALGAGREYANAFEFGCNAINLEGIPEGETPVLKCRYQESPPSPKPEPTPPLEIPELELTEGTMSPESRFYVERPGDRVVLATIQRQGVTLTIKGPRQMGKSSMLVRAIDAAMKVGKRVAYLDFQGFNQEAIADADVFYRQFCLVLTEQLGLPDRLEEFWKTGVGNNQRCTSYMQSYVLRELDSPLVLAMDEVDRMFDATFRSDFFSMLRSWHNNRALPMNTDLEEF